MFGMKSRRELKSAAGNRIGAAVLQIVGPAMVEGAIQGHSPEARAQYKRRLEENKRRRREEKAQREAGDHAE